jgi:thiamine biosynthesis lipoprotein
MKKGRRLLALGLALLLGLPAGCSRQPLKAEEFLLDTFITITLYEGGTEQALAGAVELCREYEKLLSRSLQDSDIFRLNHAGGAWVPINEKTAGLIRGAGEYYELSGGLFDITILPVSELWDFKSSQPSLPEEQELSQALKKVGYGNIELKQVQENWQARLKNGAMIDLGGIAKGFIADEIAAYLQTKGVRAATINLGGNILTLGAKKNGEKWNIGLQSPDSSAELLGVVSLAKGSVVTSGSYERCFELNGQVYHHILDPRTGYPAQSDLKAVTVICENSQRADALSTCCFLLGSEVALQLIEQQPEAEALLVLQDGSLVVSSGIGGEISFKPAQQR